MKSIFDQCPQSGDTVTPSDLLAVAEISPRVGNRNLDNFKPSLHQLGCDLRFKIEAITVDRNVLDRLSGKQLVTGLHVGNGSTVEQIGDQSQK